MLLGLGFIFIFLPLLIDASTGETALITRLFSFYDKRIRPTTGGRATLVSTSLNYFVLLTMEQQEEYIRFGADIRLSWNDPVIQWTPAADNDYTSRLLIRETDIWRPDIAVVNSLSQMPIISDDDRLAEVDFDGSVFTTNPSVYETWCRLNVDNFPFDTQTCSINIGSWVYTASETTIRTNDTEIKPLLGTYDGNSEWDIKSISVTIETNVESGDTYQEVHYNIRLSRRAAYYVFVLLVPTFIVTTLCILGLFTPLDNFGNRAERATLGLTTLLSLSVILNLVGNDMPKQSRLPRLAVYVLAEIIVCSIGVLITIAIQMAHQRVNTRLLMPPSQKAREHFPHSAPDKLGLRVLTSAEGVRTGGIVDEIEKALREINVYLERTSKREELLRYWVKVFDRMDIVFLVLLQLANIILTIVALAVNF